MNIKKAVIPAAGLGTRFLPATKALPKEMLPVVDKPVIQFIVEEAIESGVEEILIISGRHKRAIEDHFDKSLELEAFLEERGKLDQLEKVRRISSVRVHYIRQKEPRGLGDAVLQARAFIGDEPFALLLGDDIVEVPDGEKPGIRQLMDLHAETGCPVIGVQEVSPQEVSAYGIALPEAQELAPGEWSRVIDLVEKPRPDEAPSRLAVMGRYILDGSIFPVLERTPPGLGREIQLTDALRTAAARSPLLACRIQGTRHDVGSPSGFLKANLTFALRDPRLKAEIREWMRRFI